MSITVSIAVEGDGLYMPGTAVVRVNGAVHARLRTGEGYEVTVPDPTFTTKTLYARRASGATQSAAPGDEQR